MADLKLSRRGFLKASAATASLAAAGGLSTAAWQDKAFAEEEKKKNKGLQMNASTCNACSNKCGMVVYSRNGRLWKVTGDERHPYSKGTLCARGHGFATNAYNDARLTDPMKRNEDGTYSPITWEQAYEEIGAKVKQIVKDHGPQALAMVNDPRPSGQFYSQRFIKSFGSANWYTHAVACNLSRNAGWQHVLKKIPSPDLNNAECVMFIGRSYGDGIRPSSAMSLAKNRKRGLHIIMVDPRFNSTAHMCQDWVPIRPGTDLALILAMSHVLIKEDIYNHEFVEKYTTGFDEFADAVKGYTPEWASEITTIPAERIEYLARTMAKHAPRAFIEQSWRAAMGCSYNNSTECGRAMALFNALLGCYGVPGGMYWGSSVKLGPLEEPKFKKLPEPVAPQYGSKEFPLALTGTGVANCVATGAKKGDIKAAFFYHSNPAMGYGNPDEIAEDLQKLELLVDIEVQMSETACIADYVLPDTTYIERAEVPAVIGGKLPVVSLRKQGIDVVHPNTRPVDVIFKELAEACGVGEYFTWDLQDVIDAQLAPFGAKAAEIKEQGIAEFPENKYVFPDEPKIPTEDGLIHFADDLWIKGGLGRNIQWIDTLYHPDTTKDDEFRLIAGKQSIHTHTCTTNIPYLIQMTKDYNMHWVWVPASRAKKLGIEEGDWIEVSSECGTSKVQAHVTERLHPDCIWTASHYGTRSPYLKEGAGLGLASMDHTHFHFEPYVGSCMSQENVVHVKKAEV